MENNQFKILIEALTNGNTDIVSKLNEIKAVIEVLGAKIGKNECQCANSQKAINVEPEIEPQTRKSREQHRAENEDVVETQDDDDVFVDDEEAGTQETVESDSDFEQWKQATLEDADIIVNTLTEKAGDDINEDVLILKEIIKDINNNDIGKDDMEDVDKEIQKIIDYWQNDKGIDLGFN